MPKPLIRTIALSLVFALWWIKPAPLPGPRGHVLLPATFVNQAPDSTRTLSPKNYSARTRTLFTLLKQPRHWAAAMALGTAVYTSIPSHAPFEYAAAALVPSVGSHPILWALFFGVWMVAQSHSSILKRLMKERHDVAEWLKKLAVPGVAVFRKRPDPAGRSGVCVSRSVRPRSF